MSSEPRPPLYDPSRTVAVDPADAVRVAHDFVTRCRRWATERELPARRARVQADASPEQAAKLHAWLSYVAFLDHTLQELEAGTLDHWFREGCTGGASLDGHL